MRRRTVFAALVGAAAMVLVPVTAQGANSHANYRAVCPGPTKGHAHCHVLVVTDRRGNPQASSSPTGLDPGTIRGVYGFPTSATEGWGTGATIAIVDAYDDPTAESDLATFSGQYGLPSCTSANGCFTKVGQNGSAHHLPHANAGWALEISLDVQWVHAIAPGANILLVEAKSATLSDLLTAESYATSHAQYVSNSWGASEFSSESAYDGYFSGSDVFVSAGDTGLPAEWPSASPNVISVGGTTLTPNSDGTWSETAWSYDGQYGGGGGCSAYETATSDQYPTSKTLCHASRATPDVALDANPSSGVSVYDSTSYQGQSGWFTVGGTSASTPMWAAASADSGQTVDSKYVYGSNISFNDVTVGNNGAACGSGYDLCTGLGSWIYSPSSQLSSGGSATPSPDFTLSVSPTSQTVTQGVSASKLYTVSTTDINNDKNSVKLSVTGSTGTLPSSIGWSFSSNPVTPGSSSTLTVTTASTTPAGSYGLTISGSDGTNTHMTTVTLDVQSTTQSTMNVTIVEGTHSKKGPNYWVPLTVNATDSSNNGIAGASVQLDIYQGSCGSGGSLAASGSATTDSSGNAAFNFHTKSMGSWCAQATVTASGYTTPTPPPQQTFKTP